MRRGATLNKGCPSVAPRRKGKNLLCIPRLAPLAVVSNLARRSTDRPLLRHDTAMMENVEFRKLLAPSLPPPLFLSLSPSPPPSRPRIFAGRLSTCVGEDTLREVGNGNIDLRRTGHLHNLMNTWVSIYKPSSNPALPGAVWLVQYFTFLLEQMLAIQLVFCALVKILA